MVPIARAALARRSQFALKLPCLSLPFTFVSSC